MYAIYQQALCGSLYSTFSPALPSDVLWLALCTIYPCLFLFLSIWFSFLVFPPHLFPPTNSIPLLTLTIILSSFFPPLYHLLTYLLSTACPKNILLHMPHCSVSLSLSLSLTLSLFHFPSFRGTIAPSE